MRRAGRILLRVLGIVLLLPVLGLAVVSLGLNTGPGRRAAEQAVAGATGGQVVLDGLSGRFQVQPGRRILCENPFSFPSRGFEPRALDQEIGDHFFVILIGHHEAIIRVELIAPLAQPFEILGCRVRIRCSAADVACIWC